MTTYPKAGDLARKAAVELTDNPAGVFTAKGERMYEDVKAGYVAKRDPRAAEIAARTVWAQAKAGTPGLVRAGHARANPCDNPGWYDGMADAYSKGLDDGLFGRAKKPPKITYLAAYNQGYQHGQQKSAKSNPEDAILDGEILDGMERALWVTSYADWVEQQPRETQRELGPGAGGDWNDVAPDAPATAREAAEDLQVLIERKNDKTLGELLAIAAEADGKRRNEKYADSFGHYLAMMALGHGVSWFDDHRKFPYKNVSFEAFTEDGEELWWSPQIKSRQNPPVKLTELEYEALDGIAHGNFGEDDPNVLTGEHVYSDAVWRWSATRLAVGMLTKQNVAGVLSSLMKKGLVGGMGRGREATVWMTRAGFDAYQSAKRAR